MNSTLIASSLTAALVVAGCAGAPERPTADMTRAQTLIDQAEKQNSREFAAAEIERARQKLSAAERAEADGREDEADRLAAQAALDAEFAAAKAASSEARKAADELDRSIQTLRQEAQAREKEPT
jgi:hypothetical protein